MITYTAYGVIQEQIGLRQIQLLCFLFYLHEQFIHSLHLSWASYGWQISKDIFLRGCFRGFKKNPFHAGMTCFSLLPVWLSILQTMSSCFDNKLSNWLRSICKFWIGNGFGRCLLLMYDCSFCGTGLNEQYLLVEGSEMCVTLLWNPCLLEWLSHWFRVKSRCI